MFFCINQKCRRCELMYGFKSIVIRKVSISTCINKWRYFILIQKDESMKIIYLFESIMDPLKRQRYWFLFTFFVGFVLLPSVDFVTDIITAVNYLTLPDSFYLPQDETVWNRHCRNPSPVFLNYAKLNCTILFMYR